MGRFLEGINGGRTPRDVDRLMDLYRSSFKLDELLPVLPAEKINEAIAAVAEPTTLRNVITF